MGNNCPLQSAQPLGGKPKDMIFISDRNGVDIQFHPPCVVTCWRQQMDRSEDHPRLGHTCPPQLLPKPSGPAAVSFCRVYKFPQIIVRECLAFLPEAERFYTRVRFKSIRKLEKL